MVKRDSITSSDASKFGQMIGEAFQRVVYAFIKSYLAEKYERYELLEPEEGRKLVTLEMLGGTSRQLDSVIIPKKLRNQPIALLETKWLKDARHHNDKGAWILQLREVRNRFPTVRGAAAILAGYWTEAVGVMFLTEGGVKMVWVATDEEVYSTLQKPLNDFLGDNTLTLDAKAMRQKYERPSDLTHFIVALNATGILDNIATMWLAFPKKAPNGVVITGADLIRYAIDQLLAPLPENPGVQHLEIALQITTGNRILRNLKILSLHLSS